MSGYDRAVAVRRPAGFLFIDGQQVADGLQCVHCNAHWIPVHGSGITRGFCRNCMGPICGKADCFHCTPFEKKLDLAERRGRR